jgi:hypothetical protein
MFNIHPFIQPFFLSMARLVLSFAAIYVDECDFHVHEFPIPQPFVM